MFKVYRILSNSSRLYMLFELVVIASKLSLIYRLWLKKQTLNVFEFNNKENDKNTN